MRFLRACAALARRDLEERLSYRAAAVLELASMAAHALVFFFVAMLVPDSAVAALAPYGGRYFPFVLLGIAFANFHSAALTGLSAALSREADGGKLEMIWLTPAGIKGVLAAGWATEIIWAAARALCYFAVGFAAFGAGLLKPNPLAALTVLALTLTSLAGLGLLSAAFLLVHKRGDPVSLLLNGASRLLCGVYFPVALLPAWLKPASLALPLTYGLEGLRKSLLQGQGLGSLGPELLALGAWSALALPLGLWTFSKAVERARRDGSLALR